MSRDEELEALRAGVSCAVVLETHPPPWQLDKRESTKRCLKYRRGEGEIILVTHEGRGWWDPGSTAKGDVFSLVQHLKPGLNLGQVRKVLRPLAGLSPSFPPHLRTTDRKRPGLLFDTRWERSLPPACATAAWRYLTVARRLPQAVVVAAIRAGVLREGPHASAWFAHHDHQGRLTGFEMRGPDYRGFSAGGGKTLFRLPGRHESGSHRQSRLVVAEAPIDAMSVAALEDLRGDSFYLAVGGGMGPETLRTLDLLLHESATEPGATLVAATDADRAGDNYAVRLEQMSRDAGLKFERLRPPVEEGDWNEMLGQGRGP